MAAAAKATARNPGMPVCYLPSHFCNQSLFSLRNSGAKLIFYRILSSFCPDWKNVYELSKKNKPDLFVLVHYFGRPNDHTGALEFIKHVGCTLLEDCAHVLIPDNDIKSHSIRLYSPHKLLPLPPIALLTYAEGALARPVETFKTGWRKEDSVWWGKRFIQALMGSMAGNLMRDGDLLFQQRQERIHIPIVKNPVSNAKISLPGMIGFQTCHDELKSVGAKRLFNYFYLAGIIREHAERKDIFIAKWPEGQIPYLFPLSFSAGESDSILKYLQQKSIPAHKWPDLPPEVINKPRYYQNTFMLRERMAFLPIHQTLRQSQLDYMAQNIINFINGSQ